MLARIASDAPEPRTQSLRLAWRRPEVKEAPADVKQDRRSRRVLNGRGGRLDNTHYSIIPARAVDDQMLGGLHLRVLAHIGRSNARKGFCEISQSELARKWHVHRQSICRALADLVRWAYLDKLSQRERSENFCAYRTLIDEPAVKPIGDTPSREGETCTSTGCRKHTTGVSHHRTPNKETDQPDLSDQPPVPQGGNSIDHSFEEFWNAYPRQIDRQQALYAYHLIVLGRKAPGDTRRRRPKQITRATAEDLLAGAQRFAAANRGKDPEYIPYPARWLEGARWTDHWAKKFMPSVPATTQPSRVLNVSESEHPEAFAAWLENERVAMVERRPNRYSMMTQHRFIGGVPSLFPPAQEAA